MIAGAEGGQAQQPEVEHRVGHQRGVADVERGSRRRPTASSAALRPDGHDVAPDGLEAEHQPDQADRGQNKAQPSRSGGGRPRGSRG